MKIGHLVPLVLVSAVGVSAQITSQTTVASEGVDSAATYHQAVTYRTVQAVNYEHHEGATKVDFVGTDLMPSASGHAKVESRRGAMGIGAEFV